MQKDYERKIAEIEKNAKPDNEIDYSDAPKLTDEQLAKFKAKSLSLHLHDEPELP